MPRCRWVRSSTPARSRDPFDDQPKWNLRPAAAVYQAAAGMGPVRDTDARSTAGKAADGRQGEANEANVETCRRFIFRRCSGIGEWTDVSPADRRFVWPDAWQPAFPPHPHRIPSQSGRAGPAARTRVNAARAFRAFGFVLRSEAVGCRTVRAHQGNDQRCAGVR